MSPDESPVFGIAPSVLQRAPIYPILDFCSSAAIIDSGKPMIPNVDNFMDQNKGVEA